MKTYLRYAYTWEMERLSLSDWFGNCLAEGIDDFAFLDFIFTQSVCMEINFRSQRSHKCKLNDCRVH